MNIRRIYHSLLVLLFLTNSFYSVSQSVEFSGLEVSHIMDLPEPFTNGAVESIDIKDSSYLYLFGGMDSTLTYTGIHKRCYKININSKVVTRLPDLPDSLGRIALSADRIGDKIYVVGGNHLFADSSVKTSSLVHEFDPLGDTFTTKKIVLPIPVGDHVQLVYNWRDYNTNYGRSLLYVIGGQSYGKNVRDVQIYEPDSDKWHVGTSLPDSRYLAFGAAGYLYLNGEIVFVGGASDQVGFPVQRYVRQGLVDRKDPIQIKWSILSSGIAITPFGAANVGGLIIGGADSSYNYAAKAYSSGKVLNPTRRIYFRKWGDEWTKCEFKARPSWRDTCVHPGMYSQYWFNDTIMPLNVRDLGIGPGYKGFATWHNNIYMAGGILGNQKVSNKLLRFSISTFSSLEEYTNPNNIKIGPNPVSDFMRIQHDSKQGIPFGLYSVSGALLLEFMVDQEFEMDFSIYDSGLYLLRTADGSFSKKFIKQ